MKLDKDTLEITNISVYNLTNYKQGCIVLDWISNIGWGQCTLWFPTEDSDEEFHVEVDSECMCSQDDKEFLSALMEKLVNMAQIVE